MRWPLRRQLALLIVSVLVLTIGVVSALNAGLAMTRESRRLQTQLTDVARTLAASNFPLEASVLRQARGLIGAELVVADAQGQPLAVSDDALRPAVTEDSASKPANWLPITSTTGQRYIRAAIPLDRRPVGGPLLTLHVFYPEATWRDARWQSIWPPLLIGAVAVAIVMIATPLAAAFFTRPIERLRHQVGQIAQGHFAELPLPSRDDEFRGLATAVNQMAQQLARYEDLTRKSERLRTLGTLGGGIAHQIRNAATGCRIALDLHQRECPASGNNGHLPEPLSVAVRQLAQIETHIQRFLTLGKPASSERDDVNLAISLSQAIDLVRPLASYVEIGLELVDSGVPATISADSSSLVQLFVNLLCNGVEAAAQQRLASHAASSNGQNKWTVEVKLSHAAPGYFQVAIGDPGSGPSPAIQPRLFEPFVTDKPNGTGLGLAVARQIVEDHQGTIRWERRNNKTWFLVDLPANNCSTKILISDF